MKRSPKISFFVKTAAATVWATFEFFGLLFIFPTSGHTDVNRGLKLCSS